MELSPSLCRGSWFKDYYISVLLNIMWKLIPNIFRILSSPCLQADRFTAYLGTHRHPRLWQNKTQKSLKMCGKGET